MLQIITKLRAFFFFFENKILPSCHPARKQSIRCYTSQGQSKSFLSSRSISVNGLLFDLTIPSTASLRKHNEGGARPTPANGAFALEAFAAGPKNDGVARSDDGYHGEVDIRFEGY